MKLNRRLLFIGVIILTTGIYLSSLLSTTWVITGTLMTIVGGGLTGISVYNSISTKKK